MVVDPTSISTDETRGSCGIINRLRAAFGRAVPTGYEDKTGFHLGEEPLYDNESNSPFQVQDFNKF